MAESIKGYYDPERSHSNTGSDTAHAGYTDGNQQTAEQPAADTQEPRQGAVSVYPDDGNGATVNIVTGDITGEVIQKKDITGGVKF